MTLRDDKETIGLFEPLMVSEGSPQRGELNDLALDLAARAAAFRSSLPDQVAAALAALIRSMNCYYQVAEIVPEPERCPSIRGG